MPGIELRTDYWPIVITVLGEDVSEADLDPYFDRFMRDAIGRRQIFASVVDAMATKHAPSARVRQKIAEWEKANFEIGARYNAGIAIATSSMLVRGAMTAINWLVPPAVPTSFEPTPREAILWATARLEERKIHVPAIAKAYGVRDDIRRVG